MPKKKKGGGAAAPADGEAAAKSSSSSAPEPGAAVPDTNGDPEEPEAEPEAVAKTDAARQARPQPIRGGVRASRYVCGACSAHIELDGQSVEI